MLRAVLLLIGAGGVLWSLVGLPSFRLTTPARAIVARIVVDQRFRPGVLADALSRITAHPVPIIVQPELKQAEALIRLSKAEDAMLRDSAEQAEQQVKDSESSIRASLSASPSDSFLWLLLYSTSLARRGLDPSQTGFLVQSYRTGPFEGWISLRRNRLALAAWSALAKATQDTVVSEFAALVDSDFIEEASINLTTAGWSQRERLAASLAGVDIAVRERLVKRLAVDAVKIKIPGVETDDRPWK
ncbi:hypothetical protein IVB03_08460 [Bradyrhizobium sp. 168]|uniref:hypothetical protein n=1 Tax=unclassified Bradyrhizobium TaxID=2631580 RepID=UPI001FFA9E2E|nr:MULTISPECIES: hypothetical protein [unclassified Bradyrhizobium]MCK1579610.1 hypothetical protein [Bradyrhizobium sp. 168]UPK20960.1 hypothetical protein IVA73_08550 [Bradyrhizobium sp. 131]